jgi:hypothetical protein
MRSHRSSLSLPRAHSRLRGQRRTECKCAIIDVIEPGAPHAGVLGRLPVPRALDAGHCKGRNARIGDLQGIGSRKLTGIRATVCLPGWVDAKRVLGVCLSGSAALLFR